MIPPDNRIPATIITGFLGSGKVRAPKYSAASARTSLSVCHDSSETCIFSPAPVL
jgi:hypothetical protein